MAQQTKGANSARHTSRTRTYKGHNNRDLSFHVALRPQRRDGLLRTGTEWEGDETSVVPTVTIACHLRFAFELKSLVNRFHPCLIL